MTNGRIAARPSATPRITSVRRVGEGPTHSRRRISTGVPDSPPWLHALRGPTLLAARPGRLRAERRKRRSSARDHIRCGDVVLKGGGGGARRVGANPCGSPTEETSTRTRRASRLHLALLDPRGRQPSPSNIVRCVDASTPWGRLPCRGSPLVLAASTWPTYCRAVRPGTEGRPGTVVSAARYPRRPLATLMNAEWCTATKYPQRSGAQRSSGAVRPRARNPRQRPRPPALWRPAIIRASPSTVAGRNARIHGTRTHP